MPFCSDKGFTNSSIIGEGEKKGKVTQVPVLFGSCREMVSGWGAAAYTIVQRS